MLQIIYYHQVQSKSNGSEEETYETRQGGQTTSLIHNYHRSKEQHFTSILELEQEDTHNQFHSLKCSNAEIPSSPFA
jgi:hypothetical protein